MNKNYKKKPSKVLGSKFNYVNKNETHSNALK